MPHSCLTPLIENWKDIKEITRKIIAHYEVKPLAIYIHKSRATANCREATPRHMSSDIDLWIQLAYGVKENLDLALNSDSANKILRKLVPKFKSLTMRRDHCYIDDIGLDYRFGIGEPPLYKGEQSAIELGSIFPREDIDYCLWR